MLRISNLNSSQDIAYKEDKTVALSGILADAMKRVPVYLVDEETMDKFYPPQKRRLLNEECIKELLYSEELREIPEEVLERCFREAVGKMVAVGLYLKDVPDDLREEIYEEPVILICPERCVDWGSKTGVPAEFVFTKVLFHEVAHAYLDVKRVRNRYYDTWWGKVIEESFANYITLTRFKSYSDRSKAIKLIVEQPLEYKGSLVLEEKLLDLLPPLLSRNIVLPFIIERMVYGVELIHSRRGLFSLWKEFKAGNASSAGLWQSLALYIIQNIL